MDITEIGQYLDENQGKDEVKNFVNGRFYTPEKLTEVLESESGLKIIQPKLDKHFNKGLESWKKNNLQSLIDEEVNKRNPADTPEQKRLRELEQKIESQKKETNQAKLRTLALSQLEDIKLPTKFAGFVLGDDENSTLERISEIQKIWNDELEKRIDEVFKKNGRRRPDTGGGGGNPNEKMNSFIRKSAGY